MHMRLPTLDSFPFLKAVKRHIRALGRPPGAYRTDPEVAGEIARDLSLTVSELYSLAAREAGRPGKLLDKRLKSVGLGRTNWPESIPTSCGICSGCVGDARRPRPVPRTLPGRTG